MDKIYDILQELRPELNFREIEMYASSGYLDSFDIVAIVDELEDHYDILIDAFEIVPENFDSVEAIAALVKKSGGTL